MLEFLFERPWATKAKCSLYIARSYFYNEVDDIYVYNFQYSESKPKRLPCQVGVCYGAGEDQEVAREEAARSALNYLRVITTN